MPCARALVVCVVGPTAAGKTDLGLDIAERLDGEIVSADSMQVYKGMDIGTAKLPGEKQRGIPHHMIDIVPPTRNFTAYEYAVLAREAIDGIRARGRLPVVVGGTGLYVKAIVDHLDFSRTARDDALRASLAAEAAQQGAENLHERLRGLDPEAAARIHPRDARRIIRALEIVVRTGRPVACAFSREEPPYECVQVGLSPERSVLYRRIDARVDHMMNQGLLDEVRRLMDMGCTQTHTAMQAIGYKELFQVLQGELTLESAAAAIKQASRRYAKRQLSWFRADSRVVWYDSSEDDMMALRRRVLMDLEHRLTGH